MLPTGDIQKPGDDIYRRRGFHSNKILRLHVTGNCSTVCSSIHLMGRGGLLLAGSILGRVMRPNLHDASSRDEDCDGIPILAVQTNAFQEASMFFQCPSSLSVCFLRPSTRARK